MTKIRALAALMLGGFVAFTPPASAQARREADDRGPSAPSAVAPQTPLRREALQLIREDVARTTRAPVTLSPDAAAASPSSPETVGEVVALEPFVVRERKPPEVSTPRETPTQKFFRTGTLAQHEGKNVTTQFWVRGDSGVMLSFRW